MLLFGELCGLYEFILTISFAQFVQFAEKYMATTKSSTRSVAQIDLPQAAYLRVGILNSLTLEIALLPNMTEAQNLALPSFNLPSDLIRAV